jgi:uncharacterized protein YhjY with autotransporter beta-barrel domain
MYRLLTATALAAILALAPAHAETPAAVYVLGDSSADLGAFGPDRRPTNVGQIWSERLAARLRLPMTNARLIDDTGPVVRVTRNGGASYALNGATALPFSGVFTLRDQVDFLLQDHPRLGSGDLIMIWISRNDITTSFAEGVPYDPAAFAAAYGAQVDRLRAAGARNLVAFGAETDLIPVQLALDVGVSADELATLRQATVATEAALWPALASRGVYILDLNKLAEDVRTNLSAYGFTAGTNSYQGRGDTSGTPSQARRNDGNVFTEDGHYTTQMQAVIADYALAQLRARDQMATVVNSTAIGLRGFQDQMQAEAGSAVARSQDGWAFSADVSGGTADQDATSRTGSDFSGDVWRLGLGATRTSGAWAMGIRLGAGRSTWDFDGNTGTGSRTDTVLSGFVARTLGSGFSAEAVTTVGLVDLDRIERHAILGDPGRRVTARGETDGDYSAFGVGMRYGSLAGAWRFGAEAGVTFDRVHLHAFDEAPGVIALSYGAQIQESSIAHVGLSVERVGASDTRVRPFAQLSYSSDLNDDPVDVRVGPTRSTIVSYAPERAFRSNVGGVLGVRFDVAAQTDLVVAARSSTWFDGDRRAGESAVTVGVQRRF